MTKMKINDQLVKVKLDNLDKFTGNLKGNYLDLGEIDGFNIIQELGDYQSYVFDCPLYRTHKLVSKFKPVVSKNDDRDTPIDYIPYGAF